MQESSNTEKRRQPSKMVISCLKWSTQIPYRITQNKQKDAAIKAVKIDGMSMSCASKIHGKYHL